MSDTVSIALDAMSGDLGAETAVQAAIGATRTFPDLRIILVGDEAVLAPLLSGNGDHPIEIRHASEVVTMDDALAQALRGKRDSSKRVAVDQVREGNAAACVSCGNTGALMAIARFVLKTLSGVDRPAIIHCHSQHKRPCTDAGSGGQRRLQRRTSYTNLR